MEVINHKIKSNEQKNAINSLQEEAYNLKISLNQYLEPDITILSSNPLKNYCSVLGRGIFSNHNNQYYLLQKLNEKINLNIKIDFKLLDINENEDGLGLGGNLMKSFNNKKGKILVIQSDDFTDDGEILLESKYGESELLTNDNLKLILPVKKINYEIVILCFINSIKLKNTFKDKTNYLITFNEIDYKELDFDSLFEYNKLSLEFIINFIEKTTVKNIEDSFAESKKIFIEKFNKTQKKFKQFENHNFIDLKKPDYNANKIINYNTQQFLGKKKNKIYFYYPLFNLDVNARRSYLYSDDILNIIKRIYQNKERFIYIEVDEDYKKEDYDDIDDNNSKCIERRSKVYGKAKQIGIETMKFFHRHQTFKHLFCIFGEQDKVKLFKEIKDINESILILINNNKIQFFNDKNEDPLEDFKNLTYLIINQIEKRNKKKQSEKTKVTKTNIKNELKEQKNYFDDFDSIFTYNLNDDYEDSSESS